MEVRQMDPQAVDAVEYHVRQQTDIDDNIAVSIAGRELQYPNPFSKSEIEEISQDPKQHQLLARFVYPWIQLNALLGRKIARPNRALGKLELAFDGVERFIANQAFNEKYAPNRADPWVSTPGSVSLTDLTRAEVTTVETAGILFFDVISKKCFRWVDEQRKAGADLHANDDPQRHLLEVEYWRGRSFRVERTGFEDVMLSHLRDYRRLMENGASDPAEYAQVAAWITAYANRTHPIEIDAASAQMEKDLKALEKEHPGIKYPQLLKREESARRNFPWQKRYYNLATWPFTDFQKKEALVEKLWRLQLS